MTARHRLTPFAVLAAATALSAACAEVGSPDAPAQLSVDTLRATTVLLDDVLRDSAGTPIFLSASVYDIDGDEIADAPVRFSITNPASGITIDSVTGEIAAPITAFTGAVRQTSVFARIGRLQTPPIAIAVVRAPTTVLDDTAALVTDNIATTSQQATLAATVLGDTTVAGNGAATGIPQGPVGGVWVRFEPVSIPATLVDSVVLVDDFTTTPLRRRSWARTASNGIATQRARVFFNAEGPVATADTIDFRAILLVRGEPVDTATVRLPIVTRAATPATVRASR